MRIGLAGVGRIGAFHAATLKSLDGVDQLIVTDADPEAAAKVAAELDLSVAPSVEQLLDGGVDALVISTATPSHSTILRQAVAAGVPAFCEKPVAATLAETIELTKLVEDAAVPVHIGFQRRFDAGYQAARAAVQSGELGFVHTIRANTNDQAPPHASYIPGSGGIFRDCNVHDFDAIRYVTGHEIATAYATGGNKGAAFFAEAGDVDTGAAVLTLEDDTVALVSSTRYNGAGHDVRMEIMGEKGTIAVGLDDSLAMHSAEAEVTFPPGPPVWSFMERFQLAYVAELTAFLDVALRRAESPCTVRDALQAFRVAAACDEARATARRIELSEIEST